MQGTPQPRSRRHFYYSLLLHLVVLTVLVVSFNFSSTMPVLENSDQPDKIINAMVMDAPPVRPTKTISKPTPPPPQEKPQPIKQVKPEIKPQEILPEKKVIVIPDKKPEKLIQKVQQQKEKKVKQKAIENAFAKEMKEINAKSLQQQMQQEQKRVQGVQAQHVRGVVDKYKALILQAISQKWIIPNNINKNLYADLLIHLAPGGVVLDVQVIKSSGEEALDRSARAAVFRASPLPVPTDADAFESFRQFVLKVKPENVLASDSWMS